MRNLWHLIFGTTAVVFLSTPCLATTRFLTLPYNDPGVRLEQGWIYTYNQQLCAHQGIDYVKGPNNSDAWEDFEVLATSDGEALLQRSPSYGDYVTIKTVSAGVTYHTLFAHLDDTQRKLPFGASVPVVRGQVIGIVGATGDDSNGLTHLHFELRADSTTCARLRKCGARPLPGSCRLDPYGIYGLRHLYQEPSSSSDYYWTHVPPMRPGVQLLKNLSFESGVAPWIIPADGHPPATLSPFWTPSGTASALLGAEWPEPTGHSVIFQKFFVPVDATAGLVSFWYWPWTSDTLAQANPPNDFQECHLEDYPPGRPFRIRQVLMKVNETYAPDFAWKYRTFPIDPSLYRGQTIGLACRVYQNGNGRNTFMYVDDAAVFYQSTITAGPTLPSFFDDVEQGNKGWSTQLLAGSRQLWHISTLRSASPAHAWYYGIDSQRNYDTGERNSAALVSPTIQLDADALLSFNSWYRTEDESTVWDKKFVEINVNNTGWQTLDQIFGTSREWVLKSYFLQFRGSAQIRFRFDTRDSFYNNLDGWYIDDVSINPTLGGSPVPRPLD